jgi:hypothetical protein
VIQGIEQTVDGVQFRIRIIPENDSTNGLNHVKVTGLKVVYTPMGTEMKNDE